MMGLVLSLLLLTQQTEAPSADVFWSGFRASIQKHLGRPYVWGADGMKSFDCSGFVWRVMFENGQLLKRTTARKFYMMLPKATAKEDQATFGTLVFFDDLKHIGIIDNKSAFYHSQLSLGTNRSEMNAFWKKKVYGFRKIPLPASATLPAP